MADEALKTANTQHSRTCTFHALYGGQACGSRADTQREMVSEPKTLTGAKQVVTCAALGHTITREQPACHPFELLGGVCHGWLSISLRNSTTTLIDVGSTTVGISHAFQRNSEHHCRAPSLAPVLSQMKPVRILTTCYFSIHFNMKVTVSTFFWKTLTSSHNHNLELFSKALT